MSDSDVILLWAFLSSILGCQLILVLIHIIQLTRVILQAFRRKKSTGGKV